MSVNAGVEMWTAEECNRSREVMHDTDSKKDISPLAMMLDIVRKCAMYSKTIDEIRRVTRENYRCIISLKL